ncbi:MAG: ATP-binding cassette, subfamily B, bacterial [Bacteroidetes bacterium]|nr:MAG: ATP-binding cassette, subfamily B, bacterial [Bacteroidota bacterium]
MKKQFPFHRQRKKMDCGPCCLLMIGEWYGKTNSLKTISSWAGTDQEGTSLRGMELAGLQMGFDVMPVRLSLAQLRDKKIIPLPAILHWSEKHYVVLYKTGRRFFYIADPAVGCYKMDENGFMKTWTSGKPEGFALLLEPGT